MSEITKRALEASLKNLLLQKPLNKITINVAAGAPAAISATAENPKSFGKSIIFVALGESIALYGVVISILILNKV